MRWAIKAAESGIPSLMIKTYQSIINAPTGWRWRDDWIVNSKKPFRVVHGMGYSGQKGHRFAAIDAHISTVIGHLHSHGGIDIICNSHTPGDWIWAANAGCLINPTKYAFAYGKWNRSKPTLGSVVVTNRGSTPLWIPYDC